MLKISSTVSISCLLVALAVSFGASGAAAASSNKHVAVAKHRVHSARTTGYRDYAGTAAYRDPRFTRRVESESGYPFIPPDAIRMPGYIFVPGVGILGESCDLPTSSCPNEDRDVQ